MIIPVYKPWITDLEKQYIKEAVDSEWISSGPFVQKFEELFSMFIGSKYALSISNGTTACHLALLVNNVDETSIVLCPNMTFVATANAARYCNAEVQLIDIEKHTFNMDLNKLELKIKKIKSNMSNKKLFLFWVHLYGIMINMQDVVDLCEKYDIILIEDACEAIGASYNGILAGNYGTCSAFSFYGNKTITTGEGGMITTNNEKIVEKIKLLRGQGQTPGFTYYHETIGFNYRLTNLQAALGYAQIKRIKEIINEKQRIYQRYKSKLDSACFFAKNDEFSIPSYWMNTIIVNSPRRLKNILKEHDIETRPMFKPINYLPMYKTDESMENSWWLHDHGITLPSYPQLKNEEIDFICEVINKNNY